MSKFNKRFLIGYTEWPPAMPCRLRLMLSNRVLWRLHYFHLHTMSACPSILARVYKTMWAHITTNSAPIEPTVLSLYVSRSVSAILNWNKFVCVHSMKCQTNPMVKHRTPPKSKHVVSIRSEAWRHQDFNKVLPCLLSQDRGSIVSPLLFLHKQHIFALVLKKMH